MTVVIEYCWWRQQGDHNRLVRTGVDIELFGLRTFTFCYCRLSSLNIKTISDSMESSFWEANNLLAGQETCHLLWNPTLITMFTRTCQCMLFYGIWIRSTPSHPLHLRPISVLSTHTCSREMEELSEYSDRLCAGWPKYNSWQGQKIILCSSVQTSSGAHSAS
jgi:hypothetical protein